MNKLISIVAVLATALLSLTAEAQTSQCGPTGTAMVPNPLGGMVRVFCDLPSPTPRAVPTPPAVVVQPLPPPAPLTRGAVLPVGPLLPRPHAVPSPPTVVTVATPPPPPTASPRPSPPPPGPTELRVADPGGQHRMAFEVVGEWAGWLLVNGQPTLSRQASTRGNQTVWVHVDPAVNLPGGQPGQVQLQMICGGPRPRRLPPRWVWPDTWHQINPIQGCW